MLTIGCSGFKNEERGAKSVIQKYDYFYALRSSRSLSFALFAFSFLKVFYLRAKNRMPIPATRKRPFANQAENIVGITPVCPKV